MQVTYVALENWRNFTHVDVPLRQRVFVTGPNAAGKSNLLDAFRFLHDLTTLGGGLEKAVSDRGGVSNLRCLAARRYPAIVLDIGIGETSARADWRYRLGIIQDHQRQPRIKEEVIERKGLEILRRPDAADKRDSERLRHTRLERIGTNREFRKVYRFFNSVRDLHVLPTLVRQPERFTGRDPTAETFGSDFLGQLARSTPKIQQSRLRQIEEALRVAVPQLRELKLEKDEIGIPHLEGRYEHWRPNAGWQREEQFSDGTLRLMALLWSVMDGTGPLLIEEPELNLHPAVVKFLPQMLHRATRRTRRQVIVSTHSPDFLRDEGIAHGEESDLYEEIHYWAPHPANRTEVDFLLRRGDEFVAVEVKSQPRYHTGMIPGLRAIAELPGVVRRVLVYGGRRAFRTQDGVEVWSMARLQRALAEGALWP